MFIALFAMMFGAF